MCFDEQEPVPVLKMKQEELDRLEGDGYPDLLEPGHRHNTMLAIRIHNRYRGLGQERNREELLAWAARQPEDFLLQSPAALEREADDIMRWVYSEQFALKAAVDRPVVFTPKDIAYWAEQPNRICRRLMFLLVWGGKYLQGGASGHSAASAAEKDYGGEGICRNASRWMKLMRPGRRRKSMRGSSFSHPSAKGLREDRRLIGIYLSTIRIFTNERSEVLKMTESLEIREFLEKVDGTVEQVVSHIEVLDKVKHLLTIPGTDTMTTRQVADYYGVEIDTVRRVYQRHKNEIDADGVMMKKAEDFLNRPQDDRLTEPKIQFKDEDRQTEPKVQSKVENMLTEPKIQLGGSAAAFPQVQVRNTADFCKLVIWPELGAEIKVSNRGIRVFSRRAVLRIGMLMPSSRVATEVRTQLLNVFEKVPTATVVETVDNERELRKRVDDSIIAGRFAEAADYISQLTEYLE